MDKSLLMGKTLVGFAVIALIIVALGVNAGGAAENSAQSTRQRTPNAAIPPTAAPLPETTAEAAALGDADQGAALFRTSIENAPACSNCHLAAVGAFAFHSVGPNLAGVATRAGSRIEDMTAEEYLRQSILDPSIFVVPTFQNVMYPHYARSLSEADVNNLIAFLLTLSEGEA